MLRQIITSTSISVTLLLVLFLIWGSLTHFLDKSEPTPKKVYKNELDLPKKHKPQRKYIALPPPPQAASTTPNNQPKHSKKISTITPLEPKTNKSSEQSFKPEKIIKPKPYKTTSTLAPDNTTLIRPLAVSKNQETKKTEYFREADKRNELVKTFVKKQPVNQPVEKTYQTTDKKSLQQGRALLRILEHGSGPEISILWPNEDYERGALYNILRECYGMEVALMGVNNQLFRLSEPPGVPWKPDVDRISGFIRIAGGEIAAAEKFLIRKIAQRHSIRFNYQPVRIFPRNFDATLLAGISYYGGAGKSKLQQVSARYLVRDKKVQVEDITINGKRVSGHIRFYHKTRCRV